MHLLKDPDHIAVVSLLSGKKCLVAENNEVDQSLITLLLHEAGMIADVVGDGYEAVERLKAGPVYDIILIDLQMPVMDGYAAAVRIRDELQLNTPILAMTETTPEEEQYNCIVAGIQDCISKPFDLNDLYRRMARLLSKPYDLSRLDGLNDRGALTEIVNLFLTRTPKTVQEMLAEAEKQDWEKVHRYAHQLKSSTGVIGAQELVELLRRIEEQATYQKDAGTMGRLLRRFCSVFTRVETLLKQEIQ